jgi:hypothetical protein
MTFSPRYRNQSKNSLEPARVRADGTRGESNELEERIKARVAQNSAYEKYKASLHAYFNGDAPLPDNLREMLATRPGAEEVLGESAQPAPEESGANQSRKAKSGKGKRDRNANGNGEKRTRRMVSSKGNDFASLVEAIRKSTSLREGEQSVNALLAAGHALPTDAEILSKALGHSDEAVIEQALRGLLNIPEEVKSPRLLRTRLDNVALLARTSEVRSLCEELKSRLAN